LLRYKIYEIDKGKQDRRKKEKIQRSVGSCTHSVSCGLVYVCPGHEFFGTLHSLHLAASWHSVSQFTRNHFVVCI